MENQTETTTATISPEQMQILVNRKVACIANYVAEINTRTGLCAFMNLAGHVGWITVYITPSKEDYVSMVMESITLKFKPVTELNDLEKSLFLAKAYSDLDSLIQKLEAFIPAGSYEQAI